MKNTGLTLAGVIIAVIALHSYRAYQLTVIRGKIISAHTNMKVIAKHENDSVSASVDTNGNFQLSLSKGTWALGIEGRTDKSTPVLLFSDTMNIEEGVDINLGMIKTDR